MSQWRYSKGPSFNSYVSINQVPFSLALPIMTFQTSRYLAGSYCSSASVTRHFVCRPVQHLPSLFSPAAYSLSMIPVVSRCSTHTHTHSLSFFFSVSPLSLPSLYLSLSPSSHGRKGFLSFTYSIHECSCCSVHCFIWSYPLVILLDLHTNLLTNRKFGPHIFFRNCFESRQALHPGIRMGSI